MITTLEKPAISLTNGNARQQATYADYERLPEGAPYQLIEGELVMSPAPTPDHQSISNRISFELTKVTLEQDLGKVFCAPIDVYLSNTNTYQPDIIFIAQENLKLIGDKKIEGAPDLVIEILSPSTAYYDLKRKRRVYETAGVREYWIVDPFERSIEVYENIGGQFQLFNRAEAEGAAQSKLLPGFQLSLSTAFAE